MHAHRLNDLVVVGLDKFYVTNYFTTQSRALKTIELWVFFLPLQTVVYFDGKNGTVALRGLYGPNGIDISPDKKYMPSLLHYFDFLLLKRQFPVQKISNHDKIQQNVQCKSQKKNNKKKQKIFFKKLKKNFNLKKISKKIWKIWKNLHWKIELSWKREENGKLSRKEWE